ncbi:helix-turn-helix domain-containing protein [Halobacterium sp. R2-5]|uniref:helix-turn-helix domain-containing protein n=1 Tax=Halobacterium sp. R2-5 TaxID=2715751 RepID=UPI00141F809F|nr:helix-turn-helix domain-containing protein [Halobacterium sp. R2-5]NIC00979.1 bacterio-opsin activator [Halobacterium sp. R2-5]
MATEATFRVPGDEFPLGTVFEELPNATVELERIVPGADVVIPYFWVRGSHSDDIVTAFSNHPGIRDMKLIDSVEDEYLLRVEWVSDYEDILSTIARTEVPLIEAKGTAEQWTFEIRGDDRSDIAEFQHRCRQQNIPIELTALHALTPLETGAEAAITDSQQEALTLAYERGYFDTPREITMTELGEELGISQQAVASRIRRGTRRILGSTLTSLDA